MIELFEWQVTATPRAEAVVSGDTRLTYAELNELAERVAECLRTGVAPDGIGLHRSGIDGPLRPEEPVGITVPPSAGMVAALLGVLKAGGAYLPLHPAWPPARQRHILREAGVRFVLTSVPTSRVSGGLPVSAAHREPGLAYVIYTSGSTGTPKGVQVEASSVVALGDAVRRLIPFGPGDTTLNVSPLSFDMSVVDVFLPLCTGGRLAIADAEERLDPRAITRLLDEHSVTWFVTTPSMLGALVESGWAGQKGLRIGAGGEPLPGPLARSLLSRCEEVWNIYGPTETTYAATFHRVTADDCDGTVPLGLPLAGADVTVCGPERKSVAPGMVGEIVIGGTGVSRGYLGRPDLTAERFVESPKGRVFRTGDLGRRRPDGVLEYLGRADGQVKINGLRIELGEIECVLADAPDAGQVVAAVREGRLYAYHTGPADARDLLAHARARLPGYMVPAAVVQLAELPLSLNGKVDRARLPEPQRPRRVAPDGIAADRAPDGIAADAAPDGTASDAVPDSTTADASLDGTAAEVTRIWRDLLGTEAGPDEDFVSAGGNSLQLYKLRNRIRTDFGLTLSFRELLDHPTIADQARLIEKGMHNVPS